jgi:hypothetical protein
MLPARLIYRSSTTQLRMEENQLGSAGIRYGCCARRRRRRAVGAFPDGKSALMLAAARLRHMAVTKWGTRRYLDMNRLAKASEAA